MPDRRVQVSRPHASRSRCHGPRPGSPRRRAGRRGRCTVSHRWAEAGSRVATGHPRRPKSSARVSCRRSRGRPPRSAGSGSRPRASGGVPNRDRPDRDDRGGRARLARCTHPATAGSCGGARKPRRDLLARPAARRQQGHLEAQSRPAPVMERGDQRREDGGSGGDGDGCMGGGAISGWAAAYPRGCVVLAPFWYRPRRRIDPIHGGFSWLPTGPAWGLTPGRSSPVRRADRPLRATDARRAGTRFRFWPGTRVSVAEGGRGCRPRARMSSRRAPPDDASSARREAPLPSGVEAQDVIDSGGMGQTSGGRSIREGVGEVRQSSARWRGWSRGCPRPYALT